MSTQLLDTLIGRQLKDSYGRNVGVIVGLSVDDSGKIRYVGLDTGCGGFEKIDGDQIFFEDDSPTLISGWRRADALSKGKDLAQRRLNALDELYRECEITPEVYEKISILHKAQLDIYSTNCEELTAVMTGKVNALSCEKSVIEEFLGNLKLQHRVREIDDSTYQSTCDYLHMMLQRNEKEAADISTLLANITPPQESAANLEDHHPEEPVTATDSTVEQLADTPSTTPTEVTEVSNNMPTAEIESAVDISVTPSDNSVEIQDSLTFNESTETVEPKAEENAASNTPSVTAQSTP